MGMDLAEIPYEVVATSEIDKFAIKAYEAIHGHNPNLGSITDIQGFNMPKEIDLMTYSFPCTDLSKAGKQKGLTNTRSGLVYEVLRILAELKDLDNLPKVLIMENVVDLVQSKFIKEFGEIQFEIEQLGYTNYTKKLNAKDFGIAQNRDRVFMVSILGEYNYNFPKKFELVHRLKDYLEDEVDERYYLSDKQQFEVGSSDTSNALTIVQKDNHLLISEATKKGYAEAYDGDGVYINRPHQKRGVVQEGMIQTLKTSGNDVGVVVDRKKELTNAMLENGNLNPYDMIRHSYTSERMDNLDRKESSDGNSATLTTRADTLGVVEPKENYLRIRKLTPRETGRLMGMNDTQIDKQQSVMSNAQMYKQHGNGIVAQVIGLIIGMMWYEDELELRYTVLRNSHTWTKE